jgi:hypothetical protein
MKLGLVVGWRWLLLLTPTFTCTLNELTHRARPKAEAQTGSRSPERDQEQAQTR